MSLNQIIFDVHVHVRRMERSVSADIQYHAPRFMWCQLLLETLMKMSPSIHSQKDFLDEQEYHSGDAINWYTRDSFVYRLVNKVLRTRDICLISKFRFLIQDISKQFKGIFSMNFQTNSKISSQNLRFPMKFYRDQ